MRALVIAAMAVALATPVAAQDTASDYREAYTRLFGDREADNLAAAEVSLGLLRTIAGTWVNAGQINRGPELDVDNLQRDCDFVGTRISNAGDYGFTTQTLRRGEPVGGVSTYMFATGGYYVYVTDLNGFLDEVLPNTTRESLPPQQILGLLQSGHSGYARVEMVGPDVLVIDSLSATAMVLVRCPDAG